MKVTTIALAALMACSHKDPAIQVVEAFADAAGAVDSAAVARMSVLSAWPVIESCRVVRVSDVDTLFTSSIYGYRDSSLGVRPDPETLGSELSTLANLLHLSAGVTDFGAVFSLTRCNVTAEVALLVPTGNPRRMARIGLYKTVVAGRSSRWIVAELEYL